MYKIVDVYVHVIHNI